MNININSLETILKSNTNKKKIKNLHINNLFEDTIEDNKEDNNKDIIKCNIKQENNNKNNVSLLDFYNNISIVDYKDKKEFQKETTKIIQKNELKKGEELELSLLNTEKKSKLKEEVDDSLNLKTSNFKEFNYGNEGNEGTEGNEVTKEEDNNNLSLFLGDKCLVVDNIDNINNCKLNNCLKLPIIFNKIIELEDKNSYYRMGVIEKNSFFHSLMCILDTMYSSYTILNRKKEIDCLFSKLLFEMPKMWDKYNYRKIGFRREEIQNKLNLYKKIDRSIQRYVSDYFNLNIFVIKIKYNKFYICSDYKPELLTVLLIEIDDVFEPILNETGNHYFKNIYDKLKSVLIFETFEEKKLKEICVSNEKEKELKIKLLKKEKVNKIYELCIKLDITLESGLGKKKKKKEELIKEISKCM